MPNLLSPSSKAVISVALVTRSMSKARHKDKWMSTGFGKKTAYALKTPAS